MRIGSGDWTYQWIDNWVSLPESPSAKENGRTHGVAVSKTGNIIIFNQSDPAILVFDPDGNLLSAWGDRFAGAHGLTLVEEDGIEYLWLTDQDSTEVVKTTLDGKSVLHLEKPDLALYDQAKYSPTWVAVHESRFGGNGDIFLTDGYGSSAIHRYDKHGKYLATLDGSEGKAGPFRCPHSLFVDYRKSEPELYIADRANKRIQVYDLDARYKRAFGSDFLNSPCAFASWNDFLIVPELFARVAVLDPDDRFVTYLGDNGQTVHVDGWPNHPPHLRQPGAFNSPHHLAVDPHRNIYVVEWIIGGRITRLEHCMVTV